MCGIFAILTNNSDLFNDKLEYKKILYNSHKGSSRGPDNSKVLTINSNILFGFHRLSINGLDEISNQPIIHDGIYLICNGEIYNYKQIFKSLNYEPITNSDCEAIIALYKKYGIKYTIENLDGVFSFVLYDSKNKKGFVVRDPYGIRPLYFGLDNDSICFSSLLKQINELYDKCYNFKAGTCCNFEINNNKFSVINDFKYTTFNYVDPIFTSNHIAKDVYESIYKNIYLYLEQAVKKRVVTMDTDMACLLSGGLDSSLITSLVSQYVPSGTLKTYSIGMSGGSDLEYAKMVSSHINSKHTEIILTEEEFFNAVNDVIYNIESYDTTTVRASVGNYLVSKYISDKSNAKVIFNGDGSDELTGGYMYFHNCPSDIEFDHECKRLLEEIQYFDVLRSDRTISCHGLEARTPFLDRTFVNYYLSIPIQIRNHNNGNQMEKYLLRKAIEVMNPNLLPSKVLWRSKEAFSDGVSSHKKSWFEILKENIESKYDDLEFNTLSNKYEINKPTTKEQLYYREIFEYHYPNKSSVIPHFWMPKYSNTNDSSARTLDVYKEKNIT